jgi:hypothetical protein
MTLSLAFAGTAGETVIDSWILFQNGKNYELIAYIY